MRRWINRILLGLLLLLAALLTFGPTERVGVLPLASVPPSDTPREAVESATRAEELIGGIREGAEKRVVWAGAENARTPLSVVFVHGFSATRQALAPLPERAAEALGANLFETRLAGHGRGPESLGRAKAAHWMLDMAEALDVGRALGERVLVIGSSLGGALAAISAAEPGGREDVAGYVLISPAFELAAPGASWLTRPFARWWAPKLLGETRAWEDATAAQAQAWTTEYPTEALVPAAAIAQAAFYTDYSGVTRPALFILSDRDEIVAAAATREVAGRWGGADQILALEPGPRDDPAAHVLAGDLLSPDLTPVVIEGVLDWARASGVAPAPEDAEAGEGG